VDCLALEDSPNGVSAPAAAGMMTALVPGLTPPRRWRRSASASPAAWTKSANCWPA